MPTPPLFFVDALLASGDVLLTGDEGRHAARVKRLGVGERVLVSDGRGSVAECTVAEVLADGLRLSVVERREAAEPSPRLVVVQALPKGERAELAVEVMTELGVDEIVPWQASRSIVQWDGARGAKSLDRWRRTAAAATKNSRRARIPLVAELATTRQLTARIGGACARVLHESAHTSLSTVDLADAGDIVIVVGPEGGISEEELNAFAAAGATAVRMGDPVLRTSTAGAAALVVLSARLGRWS